MTGTTFTLHRTEDPSGVSGTGVVAEGWESSDGHWVVLLWLSSTPSLGVYRDIREVELLHGHEGKTRIVWDTPTQYTPYEPPTRGGIPPNWEDLLAGQKYPPLPPNNDYPDHDAHDPRD